MKSLIPFALLAGGLLIANSGKKSATSSKKSSGTGDVAKKNSEAIKEYFSKDPVKILGLNDLMADLTEKLKNEIYEYSDHYIIHLKPQYAMEAYLVAKDLLMVSKKAALNSKDADPMTKEILQNISPDVMWSEGLTPYGGVDNPFYWVWKGVNTIIIIASKNLLEQGYISE